jgi:hypothetical protein
MAEKNAVAQPMIGAPVAVGEPAHRERAEHEAAGRGADEDDDTVADMQAVTDVRCQHRQGRGLELVERLEQHEDDECEHATLDDAFAM